MKEVLNLWAEPKEEINLWAEPKDEQAPSRVKEVLNLWAEPIEAFNLWAEPEMTIKTQDSRLFRVIIIIILSNIIF